MRNLRPRQVKEFAQVDIATSRTRDTALRHKPLLNFKRIPKEHIKNSGYDWIGLGESLFLRVSKQGLYSECKSIGYLEKAMATHSSTLAWKIPWAEEPGRLQSMGSLRVGHDWATSLSLFTLMHWRRKWQPTPVFLPGESQGWGSLVGCCLWVAQSRTWLKRLSSSSSSSYRILPCLWVKRNPQKRNALLYFSILWLRLCCAMLSPVRLFG